MDDVTLTFDPSSFESALGKITGSLDSMNQKFNDFGKQGVKSLKKSEFSAINFTKALAPLLIAVGAFKSALKTIPEIGRTFSIAGSIFMKNFLWPLRKELIPILQKLLDWVRDNRAMFVRWGTVVSNIFRVIKSVIIGIWDTLKRLWEVISSRLEQIFGKTTSSVTEMANLILFKIALIAEFVIAIFGNIAEVIIDTFFGVVEAMKGFFDGMMTGIGDLGPEFDQLIKWFGQLFDLISGTDKKSSALIKTFKALGLVIGSVVGPVIRLLVTTIDGLLLKIEQIPLALKAFSAWRADDTKGVRKYKDQIIKLQQDFNDRSQAATNRQVDAWREAKEEWKQMTTIPSQISNVSNKTNASNTVNNNNIKIDVNGSSQPGAVADEVSKKLRDQLKDDKVRRGR